VVVVAAVEMAASVVWPVVEGGECVSLSDSGVVG
jgi:hypothetical protein